MLDYAREKKTRKRTVIMAELLNVQMTPRSKGLFYPNSTSARYKDGFPHGRTEHRNIMCSTGETNFA